MPPFFGKKKKLSVLFRHLWMCLQNIWDIHGYYRYLRTLWTYHRHSGKNIFPFPSPIPLRPLSMLRFQNMNVVVEMSTIPWTFSSLDTISVQHSTTNKNMRLTYKIRTHQCVVLFFSIFLKSSKICSIVSLKIML